jgi:riboflavin synthase
MYIFIEFDPVWTGLIIRKGSIALNGTSLTIVDALQDRFSVSLIPLTQQWTNLGSAKI